MLNTDQKAKVIESLTRRLEDAINNGKQLTWNSFLTNMNSFMNPSTTKNYHGFMNAIFLSFTSMAFDGDPRFIGFVQAKKMGGAVKKGEKGTYVYIPLFKNEKDEKTGEVKQKMIGYTLGTVFNVRQTALIENGIIPEKVIKSVNKDSDPIASVMFFANHIDFEQVPSNGCPFFSSIHDNIGMPNFESFHNSFAHAEGLIHELIHWTGHASRLGRIATGWTNKADYSKEELVACLGSALLLNHLGVECPDDMEQNQTAYLQSWLKPLKNDISMLVEASQAASDAANYLIKMSEEKEEEIIAAA